MTEKITMVKTLLDNDPMATDELVTVYLTLAEDKIMQRLYPFGQPESAEAMPEKYGILQCELAVRLFLRRGGEGETSHNEDGVSRVYASADDVDLLNRVTPFAKVV